MSALSANPCRRTSGGPLPSTTYHYRVRRDQRPRDRRGPRQAVYETIEFHDIAELVRGAHKGEGPGAAARRPPALGVAGRSRLPLWRTR